MNTDLIEKFHLQAYREESMCPGSAEEFARLIINECISIADKHSAGSERLGEGGRVYYYNRNISDEFRSHFGVE